MTSNNIFTTLSSGKQAQIIFDLMDLFKSNSRGYGQGEFQGALFNEDKQKWIPGHVRWTWGATTEEQWRNHLSGVRLLGQGVLCDDNRVWYACLDIDIYEIDYKDEMDRINRSKLPLVVFRTKSGGLRIAVFFSEPIEADLVITRMRRVASSLGYAGCEIFPKQATLMVDRDDCPSWIYVPFGGTHEMFSEQGCMTANGTLMDLSDAVAHIKSMRIGRSAFMEMFAEEEAAKTNGKTNGKKHPKGSWVQEDTYETTINTMFWDGPPCLWILSHRKVHDMQNNFLINMATFLKKKYPENWDKALEWINVNVLQPVGSTEKLHDIIKRMKRQDYEYMCHDEPIHSFCDPHGCRLKKYGVGNANGASYTELGMTIVERVPRIFFINVGDIRMMLDHTELTNQSKFSDKCVAYGLPMPLKKKSDEWVMFINKCMEDATKVQPTEAMKTNAYEIGLLRRWLSPRVYNFMRVGERPDDRVRVRDKEKRIYFKWAGDAGFADWISRNQSQDYERMLRFLQSSECGHHEQGPGIRDWWRSTYSVAFDLFDEDTIDRWLSADTDPITRDAMGE